MKKNTNKFFYSAAVLALLVGAQIGFAQDTFQNNLLKMEVGQSSSGGVKMTLYTNKPYNEPVVVNKKSDSEYVILLPETSNSMTASPVLNSVAGSVKGVSVKTQLYDAQTKGYTKITVRTSQPIEITSQVRTLTSESKLKQQDYDELMQQVSKKATAKTANKVAKRRAYQTPVPPKFNASKVLDKIRVIDTSRTAVSNPKTYTAKKAKMIQPVVKPIAKIVEKPAEKPIVTPVATTAEKPVVTTPEGSAAESNTQLQTPVNQPQATLAPEKLPEAVSAPIVPEKTGLDKYINIIKNNAIIVICSIAAIFLILLMAARKMAKNINSQKEVFTSNLQDQPQTPIDYSEKINDDMNWKEKFQVYSDTAQEENLPKTEEPHYDSEALDDLFINPSESIYEEDEQEEFATPEVQEILEEEQISAVSPVSTIASASQIQQEETIQKKSTLDDFESIGDDDISLEDFFNEDESEVTEEPVSYQEDIEDYESIEEPNYDNVVAFQPKGVEEEQDEIIKSEFVIDEEKGFYLVDFDDASALVGHIEDEIFVLKRFDSKTDEKLQARLNEKNGSSANYMTRVGNFKGLVEVTPEKMNLLIEL